MLNCKESKKFSPLPDQKIELIATDVVDAAIGVHRELGAGLLESVYEQCLAYELNRRGHDVVSQISVPVSYRSLQFETGFRADLVVDGHVLVELKAVETLLPVHKAQIITYLKLSEIPVGFLINFNTFLLRDGLHRFIHPKFLT